MRVGRGLKRATRASRLRSSLMRWASVHSSPWVARIHWMFRASGPIGLIIVLMSFYLIALIVWMAQRYRATVAVPRELVSELEILLEKAKYNDAYHLMGDGLVVPVVSHIGVHLLAPMIRNLKLLIEDAA